MSASPGLAIAAAVMGGVTLFVVAAAAASKLQANDDANDVRPRGGIRLAQTQQIEATPLTWDDDEGAWMITMQLGNSSVQLVLDSGSGQISAKGKHCKFTTCEGDSCTTQKCPCGKNSDGSSRKNCSAHSYTPSGQRLDPGQNGAGLDTVLSFGTQQDSVTHYKETVSLELASLSCSDLMTTPQTAHPHVTHMHTLPEDIVVHLIHAIKGTSSSNICGMSRPTPTGVPVVLSYMLAGAPAHTWSVILHERGGWFAIGAFSACFVPAYCPLVWPPSFSNFHTRFYVVRLKALQVGGVGAAPFRTLSVQDTPQFVVLDTGTTCTYAPPELGGKLRAIDWREQHSSMRLVLENGVELTYNTQQLKDPDDPGRSVFNCDPHTTLEDFDNIFAVPTILLGAVMMRDMYWEYDLDNERVGIARV